MKRQTTSINFRFAVLVCLAALLCSAGVRAESGSPIDGFNPNAYDSFAGIPQMPDGKLLLFGDFLSVGGIYRRGLARLNIDGSVDSSFTPEWDFWPVSHVAIQTNGKILVSATRTVTPGVGAMKFARLNENGSNDSTFVPVQDDLSVSIAVQRDGKILIGGSFTTLGGASHEYIARLEADGAVDSTFTARANGDVSRVFVQADGKILVAGAFTSLGDQPRNGLGRLNEDGSVDLTFHPEISPGPTYGFLQQKDGKILVWGYFTSLGGQPRSHVGRLHPDGSIDASFNPVLNDRVSVLALQPDGKILLSGQFYMLNGQYRRFARVNWDGTVDATFKLQNAGSTATAIFVQADGSIVVGGRFYSFGGETRNNLARLHPDGSTDKTLAVMNGISVTTLAQDADGNVVIGGYDGLRRFSLNGTHDAAFISGPARVSSLAVQADGKTVVGGRLSDDAPWDRQTNVWRLNTNGIPEPGFHAGTHPGGYVYCLALQPDGKILVGGTFYELNRQPRNSFGRLHSDGSLDTNFNPVLDGNIGSVRAMLVQEDGRIVIGGGSVARYFADGTRDNAFNASFGGAVSTLALQADGKILVGGAFGTATSRLIRLNVDGTMDSSFGGFIDPLAFMSVKSVVVQADGDIVVAGSFTNVNGLYRENMARLHSDGTADLLFVPRVNDFVECVQIQRDGKLLIGGNFLFFGVSESRPRLARLTSGTAAVENLAVDFKKSVIHWRRSGGCPEIGHASFALSLDNTNYSSLGAAVRTNGNWELTVSNLPVAQSFYIKGQGRASGDGRCSSIYESVAVFHQHQPPQFSSIRRLSNAATHLRFSGESGLYYDVFASASPATNWTLIGTATNRWTNSFEFVEQTPTNTAMRFYHLRTP